MSPERSAEVERIFLAAIDLPKDRWPELLARETSGDESLRREVEGLLACHDDTFLDSKDAPGKGMLTELGASALSTGEDGMLRVWNLTSGAPVHEIRSPVVVSNAGVDLSPDGSLLAMSGPPRS